LAESGRSPLGVTRVRPFWNHPGFADAVLDRVSDAVADVGGPGDDLRVVFTAHSIPLSMADTSDYVEQLDEVASRVVEHLPGVDEFYLVFQSRSGQPQVPWLEPDIVVQLGALPSQGVERVVVAPIGFISDHMEVIFDLDTQAAQEAAEAGL